MEITQFQLRSNVVIKFRSIFNVYRVFFNKFYSTGVMSAKLVKVAIDTLGQSYFKNPVNKDRSVRKFMEAVLSRAVPFVGIPNLQNCEAPPASLTQDGEAILAMLDRLV